MPENIMIEQNQDIINYINMLNLPYSAAIQNHMVNMVSGIITLEANKNGAVTMLTTKGFYTPQRGFQRMWMMKLLVFLL